MKTKICSECKIEKSLDDFYADKHHKDGKASWCKICHKKYTKKYHQEHREEIAIHHKKYCLEHQEEIKNYKKKWQEEHKEEIAIKKKKYYEAHKEELALHQKKYHEEHKNERNNNRNNRYKTDIRYKIECNLRGRINKAIQGNTKSLSTMFLIGCEHDYLMYHLQSQFTKGMSWDNHGDWHIDHIRPCDSFDLSKESEQLKCFHYSNLQPLWAKDNLLKSDKIL